MHDRERLYRIIGVQQIRKWIIQLHGIETGGLDESWWLTFKSPDRQLASKKKMTGIGFIIGPETGKLAAIKIDLVER